MRKFDLTVGNPPYTKGMDIDIHKSFSKISKRIFTSRSSEMVWRRKSSKMSKSRFMRSLTLL